ncbi:MAG: PD40 domain-containing protein [Chloroflexi bacterium]|nr:PD40 domain-containing protein [Chloroflexota bacterium]
MRLRWTSFWIFLFVGLALALGLTALAQEAPIDIIEIPPPITQAPDTPTPPPTAPILPTPTLLPDTATISAAGHAHLAATENRFDGLESPFTAQFFDNFDAGPLGIWQIGAGWSVVADEGGQALLAQPPSEPVLTTYADLYNAAIQVHARVAAGTVRLLMRYGAEGGYAAELNAQGGVRLLRGDQPLAEAVIPIGEPYREYRLRFSAVEGLLIIWVDGVEVLRATDAAPLSAGRLGFAALDGEVIVDDVIVDWQANQPMIPTLEMAQPGDQNSIIEPQVWQIEDTGVRDLIFGTDSRFASGITGNASLDYSNPAFPDINLQGAFPIWRLEGDEIAYASNPISPQVCQVSARSMPPGGANCQPALFIIPNVPNSRWDPVWSPDGTRVAYVEINANGTRADIVIRDAEDEAGTSTRIVSQGIPGVEVSLMPAWSPDGDHLAFSGGSPSNPAGFAIYTADVTGDPISVSQFTLAIGYFLPIWSQDGNQIAFMHLSGVAFFVLPFSSSPPPTPGGTPTPTVTPGYPAFTPAQGSVWGQIWAPGTAGAYAYLRNFNGVNFEIIVNGLPLATRGLAPKRRPQQPQHCEVMNSFDDHEDALRLQPSLYDGQRFFTIQYAWPIQSAIVDIPERPWLWSTTPGFDVPDSIEIDAIIAKASIGVIQWVSSSRHWLKVDAFYNGLTQPLTAYAGIENPVTLYGDGYGGCSLATMGTPTPDPDIPIVSFSATQPSFDISRGSLFDSHQPPAVMGDLGLHDGLSRQGDGSTIDVIPRNSELCIDGGGSFAACDHAAPVPVYSPVSGCVKLGEGRASELDTLLINVDMLEGGVCTNSTLDNDDRVIKLTHLDYSGVTLQGNNLSKGLWLPVAQGDLLGYLCQSHNASVPQSQGGCNVVPNNHTHLAVQLTAIRYGTPNFYIQRADAVIPFVGSPRCLFDDWEVGQAPTRQTMPLHGCAP